MEDILVGIAFKSESLLDKTFIFLMKLMGYRNQLRMNHWQTKSFAEHKLTDEMLETLDDFIDRIGENTLGLFGRPKINTASTNISDNAIVSTQYVLKCIEEELCELICLYKEADHESMVALLGEFDSDVQKFKFLSTLD